MLQHDPTQTLDNHLHEIAEGELSTHRQLIKHLIRGKELEKKGLPTTTTDRFLSDVYFEEDQDIVVVTDYHKEHFTRSPTHQHDFFEMFYVYRGDCYSTIAGKDHRFKPGSLCLYSLQSAHSISIPKPGGVIFNILIRPSLLQKTFLELLADNNNLTAFFIHSIQDQEMETDHLVFEIEQNDPISFYIKSMIVEFFHSEDSAQTQKYLQILLLGLFTKLSAEYQRSFSEQDVQAISKSEIVSYINRHCAEITLNDLAEHFHYSKRNMIYCIYRHTGKKFSELLREARISTMKRQLVETDHPISQIIEQVGYSTNRATTLFKEEVKMTMTQYRKQNKKKHQNRDLFK